MKVVFLQRLPQGSQVSIERLFEGIRDRLGGTVGTVVHRCPLPSTGLLPRVRNGLSARAAARVAGHGAVCHVTGDVHYLALMLPGKRTVLTIHDCGVLHRLRGLRRWVVRMIWFVLPVMRCAVVTTISQATRDDLLKWLPRRLHGKVRVVPNCVREEFQPHERDFNATKPVFLQVGTGWNKNVERVGRALNGIPCRLRIVGTLSDVQRKLLEGLELDFEELGRVDDMGLVAAYRECDGLIFASVFEGFGLPVLEAHATGRVVVSGDCEALREVAGQGARFVDAERVESIREGVLEIVRDSEKRRELVAEGFRNVAKYQAEAVGARYLEIYGELSGEL